MEDFHETQGGRYHRGDTVCGNTWHIPLFHQLFKNKKRQSAHCMNYDKLWYNVHKIGLYKIWFKVRLFCQAGITLSIAIMSFTYDPVIEINVFKIQLVTHCFALAFTQKLIHAIDFDTPDVDEIERRRIVKLVAFFSKIFVKAYDLVEEERDGKRYQKLIDGGQIELSNFKTSGHGVHGRVSVGRFLSADAGQLDICKSKKIELNL